MNTRIRYTYNETTTTYTSVQTFVTKTGETVSVTLTGLTGQIRGAVTVSSDFTGKSFADLKLNAKNALKNLGVTFIPEVRKSKKNQTFAEVA